MKQIIGALALTLLGISAWGGGPAIEVPAHIKKAVENADRPETDRVRDARRKPGEVLAFLGLKPGDHVADLMSGIGYYSEILVRAVGENGKVYGHNSPFVVNRFAQRLGEGGAWPQKFEQPAWKNAVRIVKVLEEPGLPDQELDLVIMVLFYHDTFWQEVDRTKMNHAVFAALKPGGVYGIVDHHAQAGSGERDVQSLHRVDVETVKKEIIAAGFVLDGESDILSNPKDSRDYNVFRDFNDNRDQTDRFVLRFRKPK